LSSTDFIPEAYTFSKNGMLFFPAQHATGWHQTDQCRSCGKFNMEVLVVSAYRLKIVWRKVGSLRPSQIVQLIQGPDNCGIWVHFLAEAINSSLLQTIQTRSLQSHLFNVPGALNLGVKWPEHAADHSSPSRAKNKCSYMPIPPPVVSPPCHGGGACEFL
jgi:hypothetical protein